MILGFEFEFPAKTLIFNFGGKFKFKTNAKIVNFRRDYLDNDNDSEFTVKTKNAPFFMNFPNIYGKFR